MDLRFDRYSYRARMRPALIACAPLAVWLSLWMPTDSAGARLAWTALFSCGVAALLPHIARDLGGAREPSLFRSWGGPPTTRLLSHQLSPLDRVTLARHHAKLRALAPDLPLPTAAEEAANISAANAIYGSAIAILRERTRDHEKFSLVFEENVSYGFRRNLWALKPFGLTFATVGLIGCMYFAAHHSGDDPKLARQATVGAAICATILAAWILIITPEWVHVAARAYADSLIGALDNIEP